MPNWIATTPRRRAGALAVTLLALLIGGCAISPPRTDDPWQDFNRKSWAFNQAVDKAVVRPVAVAYRKITNDPVRGAISDFFTNLQMPITIGNDLLQGKPKRALQASGRFLINTTLGLGGFFDPASGLGLPLQTTDFGVTLARWGVPDGPYLVLPIFGPTTMRDVWRLPFDGYLLDPLSIYVRTQDLRHNAQLAPQFLYLVNLRSSAIDAEGFLKSAYDPYVFMRDAYRQQRLYKIYYGKPPAEVIEKIQGLDDPGFDPEQLLLEQEQWQEDHATEPATRQTGDGG